MTHKKIVQPSTRRHPEKMKEQQQTKKEIQWVTEDIGGFLSIDLYEMETTPE
jgi:hypothetical protein